MPNPICVRLSTHTFAFPSEGTWEIYVGNKSPDLQEVLTFKRSTMTISVTYRRLLDHFEDVPTPKDFKEEDTIVDPRNIFMGRIISGGLSKKGKVQIHNPVSRRKKTLVASNCLYVPQRRSFWRLKKNADVANVKMRSWWVVTQTDMEKVKLCGIKYFSTKKVQSKKARKATLTDIAYVFVHLTFVSINPNFLFLLLTQREGSCCRMHY